MITAKRSKCTYGHWCNICKLGFIDLTWKSKLTVMEQHKHG